MPFISPNEAFHGYTSAIIVGIYSDMITASAVKKEGVTPVVVAIASESMSGIDAVEGLFSTEKIMFNMEKAIMGLPHEARMPGSMVIVALGPGSGTCAYTVAERKRELKDRKMTAEEVNAIIAATNTEKESGVISAQYPEHFSIDGFSVSGLEGLNGEDVVVGMVRVACDEVLEKEFAARMTTFDLRYGGMIDMRYAAMRFDHFFEKAASALLICIFEHETHIALRHEKAVYSIGAARTGYGILCADIARSFSVGIEEAKEIVRAYRTQELNDGTHASVADACAAGAQKIVQAVKDVITGMDSAHIIPGNMHVVCSDVMPEITAQFVAGAWFTDLPVERNASVSLFSEEKSKRFCTPYDYVSADFLTRHH